MSTTIRQAPVTPRADDTDGPVVPPPATVTVETREKPILYDANKKPIYRRAVFR